MGRPNAGKSTLLNLVLGSRVSIVTPKAQTTRERVLGILTEPQGQIVFIDTPGIHRAKEGGINAFMVHEAREALQGPSLVWYLVDYRSALQHEEAVLKLLEESKAPVVLLFSKGDLFANNPDKIKKLTSDLTEAAAARGIPLLDVREISALAGRGVDQLLKESWERIPEGPLHYPDEEQISDRPVRFFVAEKVREQLFLQLGDELPYSCAVQIEKFDENAKPLRIEAMIYVERESQKGMVIGKGGTKIRSIGEQARKQIEEFLGGQHVFLGLKVKVLKEWSRDAEALRRMGYNLPEPKKKKGPHASSRKSAAPRSATS